MTRLGIAFIYRSNSREGYKVGMFVGVMGDVSISEEKRETYVAQMLAVLTQGGMMQYDTIQLYGKNIMLIHKPEFDTDRGVVEWQYNLY